MEPDAVAGEQAGDHDGGRTAKPAPQPHQYVADGSHAGLRWWVERMPGAVHPVVTTNGWDGPHYVTDQAELEGASLATVRAWVEGVIAHHRQVRGKRRRKGGPDVAAGPTG